VAGKVVAGLVSVATVAAVLAASLRIRNSEDLIKTCAGITLLYLLVAAPGYWPWHACLPVALMALTPHGIWLRMILILSGCARLVAPFSILREHGFVRGHLVQAAMTGLGTALPLAILLLLLWQHRGREKRFGWRRNAAFFVTF
jgi:hypothetical protein